MESVPKRPRPDSEPVEQQSRLRHTDTRSTRSPQQTRQSKPTDMNNPFPSSGFPLSEIHSMTVRMVDGEIFKRFGEVFISRVKNPQNSR
ncbi:hypothetical protein DLD82_08470 [Methanospirillum stamsii]|uniref:Uncharacterized protein n=1 Tax=Methanospirillum stamsii TaxID=1277351 RepID=A0A2V2N7T7_9EURY|nr:hypothetical protein DLD82_08470 [Methanospirillum stamsii]